MVLNRMAAKTAEVRETLEQRIRSLSSQLGNERKRLEKAMDFMLDGTISKDDYLRKKSKAEEIQQQIAKARRAIHYQDRVKSIAMELMFDLPKLYKAATPESKNLILATLFPSGFTIDKASGVCRTPEINSVLSAIAGGSTGYGNLEMIKQSKTAQIVVLGERPEQNRIAYHFQLIQNLAINYKAA
jgi:hypothetical protein